MIRWLEWVVKTFGILQRDSVPSQRDDFERLYSERDDFELVNMSPVSESSFFLKSVQSWFVRCIEWNLCSSWLNPSDSQDQPDKMTNWSQLSWVSCNMSCGSQANNNLNLKLYFQCQWKAMQQKKNNYRHPVVETKNISYARVLWVWVISTSPRAHCRCCRQTFTFSMLVCVQLCVQLCSAGHPETQFSLLVWVHWTVHQC